MDDYVSNFSWDDSSEHGQTVRNLRWGRSARMSSLLRGRGNRGCRAGNRRKLVSDLVGRKLEKKGKDKILKDEQTSGAHVDSIANPNEQMSGFSGFMARLFDLNRENALESRYYWKKDTDIDSIANPKDCLEGD
eukprot:scaffold181308_cov51-Attheya_sp.AAC.1